MYYITFLIVAVSSFTASYCNSIMFQNRNDAGKQLSRKLIEYKNNPEVMVLGLPRGGVVVAAEVAKELNAPLDIVVSRKLSMPDDPECAMGAVTHTNECILDKTIIENYNISKEYIEKERQKEYKEALRRLSVYRPQRKKLQVEGKIVIVVDDGIATGATLNAALTWLGKQKCKKVIVAVPVSTNEGYELIKSKCNNFISLSIPVVFRGVGSVYKEFPQTSDEEVIELMKKSR